MRALFFMVLALAAAIAWGSRGGPDNDFFAGAWAVQIVDEAVKPYHVTYAPQVFKRAPDGALTVAGIATARGRDIAYQVRVERRCANADKSCFKPHIAYIGPPFGLSSAVADRSSGGADAPRSPESQPHPN